MNLLPVFVIAVGLGLLLLWGVEYHVWRRASRASQDV